MSGRALAMARRKAMSGTGKTALGTPSRSRSDVEAGQAAPPSGTMAAVPAAAGGGSQRGAVAPNSARAAALARRQALATRGKVAVQTADRVKTSALVQDPDAPGTAAATDPDCGCGCGGDRPRAAEAAAGAPPARRAGAKPTGTAKPMTGSGRAASLARRKAMSARGKGGQTASGMSPTQAARSMNPELSGRDLARVLREQRSQRGAAGQKKSAPCGRVRPRPEAGGQAASADQPWKVGLGETARGQAVTGTQVKPHRGLTGVEDSLCRTITGTEYMDAEVFRSICDVEPTKGFLKGGGKSRTASGNAVTGDRLGRAKKVTGNEPGSGRMVTGTEYVSADQTELYSGVRPSPAPRKFATGETARGKTLTGNLDKRSERVTGNETGAGRMLTGTQYTEAGSGGAPAKVGASTTLRGGTVTGSTVGRRERMTGDEAGSCRNVTGDDYIGAEQFAGFCQTTPRPTDRKVGASRTNEGGSVTGTMTGRSDRVTGNEPGTCKAVTGTPYAGADQYEGFCEAPQASEAAARMRAPRRAGVAAMTGSQPSVGGKMTGERGICEPVSGTPYVGSDQTGAACPATPAEPIATDFPQPLGGTAWGAFSTTPPNHASAAPVPGGGVTGTGYENGHITGPFGMAAGKVTGTEDARFGTHGQVTSTGIRPLEASIQEDGRTKSRISGEGMDAGPKITGDDWDRGDRVTGTEGASAMRRNPTRRGGPMTAMAPLRVNARNEQFPDPVSKVTGSSGNTEKGAIVTYSGGARG